MKTSEPMRTSLRKKTTVKYFHESDEDDSNYCTQDNDWKMESTGEEEENDEDELNSSQEDSDECSESDNETK